MRDVIVTHTKKITPEYMCMYVHKIIGRPNDVHERECEFDMMI